MDSPSRGRLWLECLELKENGYFYDAEKKFTAMLQAEPNKKSEIVIQLTDTLCLRGMYALAFECVESHISERAEDESGASGAIRMIRAFCRAHSQGIFQDGFEMVQDYQGLRTCGGKPAVDDTSVSFSSSEYS